MSITSIIRLACLVAALALVAVVPLQAQNGGCFTTIAQCFETSALIESFWFRTWEALDCELAFVGCVRMTIFGL